MTLENQALHLDNERLQTELAGLRAENARLAKERDEARGEVERLRDVMNGKYAVRLAVAKQSIEVVPVCTGCDICREALIADPDPWPIISRRILDGTLRPDWGTHQEIAQWKIRQQKRHSATPGEGGGA